MKKILFVCTGNTCRSVMAEQIASHITADFEFSSAGIVASEGVAADRAALAALEAAGFPTRPHSAVQLTTELGNGVGLIVCMNSSQRDALSFRFPYIETPVVVMPTDVGDPFGGTPERYAASVSAIHKGLLALLTEVTPFTEGDAKQATKIESLCFSRPWREDDFLHAASDEAYIGFVARFGKKVIGYAFANELLGEAEFLKIAVLPEFRRSGVARTLMFATLDACRARGTSICFLEVRQSNEGAQRLYEGFGFSPIAIRKNYYEAPCEDAVIMKKEWTE